MESTLRVLVAGCGYVGSRLARELRDQGHVVFALRRSLGEIDGVESIVADLTDASSLNLPRVDVAFFTASPDGRDERAYRAIYVDGSRNLRNALRAHARVVMTSSTAVYGQDDGSVVDERSPTTPSGFRGRVLLEAEAHADVVLRLAGIYGPGRAHALERVRRGEASFESGRYLNMIHRDDASGALLHLMSLDRPESIYVGVDEEPVESETFYRWLAERTGCALAAATTTRDGNNKRCSSARLVASGYRFRYPTFREGYAELIDSPSLAPCPPKPNCVSTQAVAPSRRMSPLRFTGSALDARQAIENAVEACGGVVVKVGRGYVRAEFSSRLFGFVDDVEWAVSTADARIDFRSASRLGYFDFGANRRRMRKIIRRLTRDEKISLDDGR